MKNEKQNNLRKNISGILLFAVIWGQVFFTPMFTASAQTRKLERPTKTDNQTNERRIALVIGNSVYKNTAALSNPANDATDMAQTLKDLGFEVIFGTDQTKAKMQNLIRQFGTRLADTKAVGLFFYAGHGIAQGGTNYLIPIDADIQAEDEIEESSISINFVLNKLETADNGFNMVILDACRNNPFARKWRSYRDIGDKGGLTRIDAPTGTLIAYATKPGDVASDGTGRNGLYTGALLKQMRVKNVEMGKMFQRVRAEVIKQSKGKQVPFDESSVVGDFYFAGIDTPVVSNLPSAPVTAKTGEAAFWQTIENSTDTQDFEDYLARNRSGEFVGIYKATAELKLLRLRKANAPAVWARLRATARNLLKYDSVVSFSEGLALAGIPSPPSTIGYHVLEIGEAHEINKKKWGFVDKTGREVIPVKYDDASSFSEGLAKVRIGDSKTGKYGFIDKTGKEVIPVKYDAADSFSEGLASVAIGYTKPDTGLLGWSFVGKYGFIDETGKEIIPLKYDHAYSFSEGLASVLTTGKRGFIDKIGKEVISIKYDDASSFSEGLAEVRIGDYETGKRGFIDKTGKEIVSIKYNDVGSFSEGLALVFTGNIKAAPPFGYFMNGKWGFIDKTGKEIVPAKYDDASSFSEGLAKVRIDGFKGGKSGFIDNTGKEITPIKYDDASSFSEGLAEVRIGDYETGKYGFIDKTGKEVVAVKYDEIWCYAFLKEGFIGVILNGKKGFVDLYGNEYFKF